MSEEHLGGAYLDCMDGNTFIPEIWSILLKKYDIKSVVDIGCGGGWNTKWFFDNGMDAVGVEGWSEALAKNQMPKERLIAHDYTNGPLTLAKRYDLCWSSEFVEHVEEKYIPNWMATAQCCRYACITYATPGQTGHHHVCEREFDFWIEQFQRYGFTHLPEDTKWMRAMDNGAAWGRKSLTFFRNNNLRKIPLTGHPS